MVTSAAFMWVESVMPKTPASFFSGGWTTFFSGPFSAFHSRIRRSRVRRYSGLKPVSSCSRR